MIIAWTYSIFEGVVMGRNKIKQEFNNETISSANPKPISPELAARIEEKMAAIHRCFGEFLPETAQTIKDQYKLDKYTILLFDNLVVGNTKYVQIDGIKYKPEICFDLPNALAIEAKGDFIGKQLYFVN